MIVGLTGGIGSGKSTVAALLTKCGALVVDADALAREALEPGRPAYAAVVARFGDAILEPAVPGKAARIDRPGLARLVFSDAAALAELNGIVHPRVGEEVAHRIAQAGPDQIVVVDVPLLVEAARQGYDAVVVVEAPEATRLERLRRRGLDEADARRRMSAQASDEERRRVADFILDNGGSRESLRGEVELLWTELSGLRKRGPAAG
ncbi:MAG: dephospho-CoA kinase [Acidimicrobiia bacterium]